jgi:hypothetical protein
MFSQYAKAWLRSMGVFCSLVAFIAISAHTTYAATQTSVKSLDNEMVIALQADNGLYLSRVNYGGNNSASLIEANKSSIDADSQFKLVRVSDNHFALQADNGLYLSRVNYGGNNGTNPIEAAKKTADPYSQFVVVMMLGSGKVALQADNGLYLSRINYSGKSVANPIEAAKSTIDSASQFTITIISAPSAPVPVPAPASAPASAPVHTPAA